MPKWPKAWCHLVGAEYKNGPANYLAGPFQYLNQEQDLLGAQHAQHGIANLGGRIHDVDAALAHDGHFGGSRVVGTAYDGTFDYLWVFGAAFLLIAPAAAWLLLRHRGGPPALRLFVVVLASVAFIHTPGAIVLKFVLGWSWTQAFALGSAVFLPFDALKAGLAVAACTAFLPQPMETPQ